MCGHFVLYRPQTEKQVKSLPQRQLQLQLLLQLLLRFLVAADVVVVAVFVVVFIITIKTFFLQFAENLK